MDVLAKAFCFGLGVAYGLLWLALVYFLRETVVEPVFEWLLEIYEQRFVAPHTNETRSSRFVGMGELVVVSDLHVDTWDRAPGGRGKREGAFFDFLRTIERTTMEVFINGDLLDAPPNPEDTWQREGFALKGSILPKYENVLAELGALNNKAPIPVPVTALYGNHDMGTSGLRYDLVKRPHLLQRFRVPYNKSWYPNVILGVPSDLANEGQEDYRFYVDHGHFYDPVLLLYLRHFVFAVLRRDLRRAMTTLVLSGQRRSSEQQVIPQSGLVASKPITTDQKIGHWLVKYRWRWKARRILAMRSHEEVRQGNRPLAGALFGHTHLPDRYTYRTGGAKGLTYVNTGDWMGDTGHGTYTIITQDGVIAQYDWLDPQQRAPHHVGG
ncbi:MAG TPA: metallophosphoesterase [bacterium]